VKVNQHRPVVGRGTTVSVKREGRTWFVVLTAEQDQPEPLPQTGSLVGFDLGIASFLADSHGGFVPNPRHGRRVAAKLEAAQRALSRFPRVRRDMRTRHSCARRAAARNGKPSVAALHSASPSNVRQGRSLDRLDGPATAPGKRWNAPCASA
jgi:putative transposase